MRYDVTKILFVGLEKKKASFFIHAQQLGMIHFIDKEKRKAGGLPEEIETLLRAIKILRGLPPLPAVEAGRREQADSLAAEVVALKERVENLREESRTLRLEIARVEMFGDFSKEDVAFIEKEGRVSVQFFWAKEGLYRHRKESAPRLMYITSTNGLDYFVGVNPEPVHLPHMVEIQIERPVGELRERQREVEEERVRAEEALKPMAKYSSFFYTELTKKMDRLHLKEAKGLAEGQIEDALFVVEGWVPVNKLDQLRALAEKEEIYVEEIAVEEKDSVPTYLENSGVARIGEDLITIYDTPSIRDKDPSLWVLFAFAFFFAFIVNDAGYGAVFLAVALFLRYRFQGAKGGTRRLIRLVTILGAATFLWGLLTTSFFGIQIGPDNPLRKVSLINWLVEKKVAYHLHVKDATYQDWLKTYPNTIDVVEPREFISQAVIQKDGGEEHQLLNQMSSGILFELALLTGVIHLILSLLRNIRSHWAGAGWIFFLIGGYLYFPYYLGVSSMANYVLGIDQGWAALLGIECLFGGFAGALLLSLLQNGRWGILEGMNVIQIFGDTLSYVRLYALGLAGGILSETINEMAGAVPFFIGAALILASHGINILLSIMGGVIHGLRLNFLEWYRYSFEGGGKPFQPLRLNQKEE